MIDKLLKKIYATLHGDTDLKALVKDFGSGLWAIIPAYQPREGQFDQVTFYYIEGAGEPELNAQGGTLVVTAWTKGSGRILAAHTIRNRVIALLNKKNQTLNDVTDGLTVYHLNLSGGEAKPDGDDPEVYVARIEFEVIINVAADAP